MMLFYYGTQLSPHMDKTPEGYLICRDVPIARTGTQEYLAGELQLDGDPQRVVKVNRYPEDVFEPAALASFEGKDVTQGHPPENVGPENFSSYTKGHVQNVRRDGDHIIADLIIKDANLVSDVWNGVTREVSCGYLCIYVPDGDGYKQQNIRGNHVAVVPRGRAGAAVSIKDQAASEAGKGKKRMKKETKEALYRFFGLAARDAEPEELEKLTSDLSKVMDSEPDKPAETPPAGDARCGTGDVMVERAPKGDDLGSKLDKVIEMLGSLQHKNDREENALHDEDDLDDLVKKLSGGEHVEKDASVTIPADEMTDMDPAARDAAVNLLKKVRPAVAAIKDEQERSRVVDALISTIKGPNVMGQVMQATAANARKAADAAKASTFEQRCREAEAAYAARNPHKKKED
ncbi:MAG: DUF2213 domain-containing protein [Oscillibacter sp.]|nr:DUF2213 domain-containing protein [Oscillibacter sp.]